jgi:predicted LPLAT superfamily acyltransferase
MIKQRGSGAGLFIVYLFFRLFGYLGLRFILFFVVIYFSLTTPSLKRYLRDYYHLCTGKFNYIIYYRHLFMFALVFSDRFLSKKFSHRYKVVAKNLKPYLTDSTKGVLFLFSHVGDWSTCGLLPSEKNVPINIVMHEAVKKSIKGFEKFIEEEPINTIKIIDLSEGSIAVAISVAKAFQKGEIVAMMADRYLSIENSVPVTFLGRSIRINKNPFEVAYNRRVPVIALHSLRESDYNYQALYHWLTPFDYTIPKEEAIEQSAQEYAAILEKVVKNYPDQWFNHYDFFGIESSKHEHER